MLSPDLCDQFKSTLRDKSMNRCERNDDEFSCGLISSEESVKIFCGDDEYRIADQI